MWEDTGESTGWLKLGKLMIKFGYYNTTKEVYHILLNKARNNVEKAHFYHQIGYIKEDLGEYEAAHDCYEKSVEIKQDVVLRNDPDFALFYNNIGSGFGKKAIISELFPFTKNPWKFTKKKPPENGSSLSICYNNLASIYHEKGDYSTVLSFYEKVMPIDQAVFPENHLHIALF